MALIFSSVIAEILFTFVVLFILLYFYFTYAYKYWHQRGVQYIKPTLFVGSLEKVFQQKESLVGLFRRIYRETAGHKVVGIYLFHKPILVARDQEVVRSVLAKDAHVFLNRFFMPPEKIGGLFSKSLLALRGKKWRHMRIKLTPTFTSGKMRKMFQLIEETSGQLLTHLDQETSTGKHVVVKDLMSRYTMDTLASCAFGLSANTLAEPSSKFVTNMKKIVQPSGFLMLWSSLLIFIPWLRHVVSKRFLDDSINEFVREIFWDTVDYRKKNGTVRKDVVDLLMQLREDGEVRADDARDLEEIKQDSKYVRLDNSKIDDFDMKLEDDDVVAQAFIFILAGYETSSSVLSFTLLEMAMNPIIQDKLRSEIEDVLKKHDHKVTYDAISEMTYLDMVVAESMRKYPTIPFLERECLSDYRIEGSDITVEKGTVVFIPVVGIHHDNEIFPDSEKFDPERFNAENKGRRSHFAYLPFGEGPRKCIGMRFGLMQVKTGLVHILKTYLVRPCEDTPQLPLEMKPFNSFIAPKQDIVLAFTKLK